MSDVRRLSADELAHIDRTQVVPRAEYDEACETIAAMHAAAVGKVCGPVLGVVEDVDAVRVDRDRLRAQRVRLVKLAGALLDEAASA